MSSLRVNASHERYGCGRRPNAINQPRGSQAALSFPRPRRSRALAWGDTENPNESPQPRQSQSCFFFRFRDISTVRGNNRANRMIAVSFVWKRHQLGELLQHAVRLEVQTRQLAPNDQPPKSEPGVRLHVPPTSFGSHGLSITIESRQDFV